MPLTKLSFKPGINRDITSYSNEGGFFDGDLIRFNLNFPEKIGGWSKYTSSTYLGTARKLLNWVALDTSDFLGVGTNSKYYIEEGGVFNDVTPLRETTSSGDVTFSATNGSSTVTITDAASTPATFSLFKVKAVGANATVELLTAPLVVQENEILKATAATANRLHVVASLLEVS